MGLNIKSLHARHPPFSPPLHVLRRPTKMAPRLISTLPQQTSRTKEPVLKSIFPDGIKTSGQHPPIYEDIKPYDAFPSDISGPTLWNADDYKNNPERWTHPLAETEIEEFSKAADDFRAAGIPLTGIAKVYFPFLHSYKITIARNTHTAIGKFSLTHPIVLARIHPHRAHQR